MKLSLDHTTRLQLAVLLGNLECRTVGETRAAWQLMDLIGLDQVEKEAIGLQVQNVNGYEAYAWDQTKSIPVREVYLDGTQAKLLTRAVIAVPKFIPSQARRWLEPLLQQLPELEDTTNGHNATTGTDAGSIANSTRGTTH